MNYQEKEDVKVFVGSILFGLALVIPIGALFHIGWNLIG
jgi:hypothetical protein